MIGLYDIDGKLPNLALMKISSYYKSLGEEVEFIDPSQSSKYEKIYASCLFTWNRKKCEKLQEWYGDKLILGGTGWDFKEVNGELMQFTHTELPAAIEKIKPDYDLYTSSMIYKRTCGGIGKKENKIKKAETIANMGIGFTSRGCIRNCKFCVVPKKEGRFREIAEIKDIINPRSNVITLYDNNLTADPYCIDKLKEIKERELIVDISQGIDVRLLTDEKAKALSEVKHLRSIHYAWDLIEFEKPVMEGIKLLSKYIKPYRHLCFILVGFNTTFEEDMYRFLKLREMKVDPYVMIYNKNQRNDIRLKHFARWVNGHIYKACNWKEYEPWIKAQLKGEQLKFVI
jgi:hypothetical protein